MTTYVINEIFYSLQGEGFNTGTASVFVRFSGCNLRCAFCDTNHQKGTPMTLHQVVDEVNRWPEAPLLVLTGGEPSLWIDAEMIATLKQLTGKRIAIETNGTRRLPQGIDWVTLSPKAAYVGGDLVPTVLNRCDELKVVYTGQDLSQYDAIEACYRFLQPCYVDDPEERQDNLEACVQAVLRHPQWRLSLQTHRLLGIR
ncbi:MAG: radical SAM protein [Muribaculaceae bacterium]|nr:radical SAM protein [Muribaculaceae bacterium]MBR1474492.1 radical SAM protein [Muribaculaceae bacterium]